MSFTTEQLVALRVLPKTVISTDRAVTSLANNRSVEFYPANGVVAVWVRLRPIIGGRQVAMALYCGTATNTSSIMSMWRGAHSLANLMRGGPEAAGFAAAGEFTDRDGVPTWVHLHSADDDRSVVTAFVSRNGLVSIEAPAARPIARRKTAKAQTEAAA